jgi:hypothetical protein
VHCRPAELGDEDVAVLLTEQLVAGLGVEPQRDLVRHRRRRQVDGVLLAEERGSARLELDDGRVLPLLLVADGGSSDRGAHSVGRPRRRVGAKIDHDARSLTTGVAYQLDVI